MRSPTPARPRRSAIERLRELPEVFTLAQLAQRLARERTGARLAPTAAASTYLARWKEQSLISPFGQVGVYFNLLANPHAPEQCLGQAVRLIYPNAVLLGASVLHQAGWTTQIPRAMQVAVSMRASYPDIPGLEIFVRSDAWYEEVHDHIEMPTLEDGIARLSPAAALVDGWRRGAARETPVWSPDPDDLEIDEVDWAQVRRACKDLSVQPPAWAQPLVDRAPGARGARPRPGRQ